MFAGKNHAGEIFLADVLKEFRFLFEDRRRVDKNLDLFNYLDQQKQNLLISSDLETFKSEQDDVSRNLFKIICAIMKQNVNQRGHNFLDDKILYTYLDSINYDRDETDLIYVDQLAAIKSLINRKTYSLTDQQVNLIHKKFKNMHDNRLRNTVQKEKKILREKPFRDTDQFPD